MLKKKREKRKRCYLTKKIYEYIWFTYMNLDYKIFEIVFLKADIIFS